MKLPATIKEHMNRLPIYSSILWETFEHERPIFLVKIPPELKFATFAIGLGPISIHHTEKQQTLIRIVLFLKNANSKKAKSQLIRVNIFLNPSSLNDCTIGINLAKHEFITVAAITGKNPALAGAKQITWPIAQREKLLHLLNQLLRIGKHNVTTSFTFTTSRPALDTPSVRTSAKTDEQNRRERSRKLEPRTKEASLSQLAKQRLRLIPTYTGFSFTIQEFQNDKSLIENIPLLAIKIPDTYPFQKCIIHFNDAQRYDLSPQKTVICLTICLRNKNQDDISLHCLFISSVQDDYKVLKKLASRQVQEVNIMAISNTEEITILGKRTLQLPNAFSDKIRNLIKNTTFLKPEEKNAIRVRWIAENLFSDRSSPAQSTSPLSLHLQEVSGITHQPLPVTQPKTLHDKYRVRLLEEYNPKSVDNRLGSQQRQRAIQNNLNALKYAHICRVKNSALHMLHDLLVQQQEPLLEKIPPLPSSNFWLELESPIPPAFGNNSVDIWAAWIRESTAEIQPGRERKSPTSRQWICTLLGKDAIEIGYTYLYSPEQSPIWSVTRDYRCPHKICMPHRKDLTKQELCANCRADLESWEKILHLLLLMHRGDYAERENVQRNNRSHIVVGRQQDELDVQKVYSMKYIDASVHQVYHNLHQPVPRGSWLAVLRATHPELIEEAEVWTKPHERYVSSLQSSVHVQGHYKTRYLRKDKIRKSTLSAKQYPDTFDQ